MTIETWISWYFDPELSEWIHQCVASQITDDPADRWATLWIRVVKAPEDSDLGHLMDIVEDKKTTVSLRPRLYGNPVHSREGGMTEEQIGAIRKNPDIVKALCLTAARYFSDEDDQQDATSEGWCRVCFAPPGLNPEDYAAVGIRAIRAYYKRCYRARRRASGKPCKSGTSGWKRHIRTIGASTQSGRVNT